MGNGSKTTAEQLVEINRIVRWTLWKIATDDPDEFELDNDNHGEYSEGSMQLIQSHAAALFQSPAWVADVVGKFAASHLAGKDTTEWAGFMEELDG